VTSVNLPAQTTFTVEAWVKRTADKGTYETFLADATSSYASATFALLVDGGNQDCTGVSDQFMYYQTGGSSTQCSGVTAQLNQWYHIAVTRDSVGTRRFFVNGILANTQTSTTAPPNSSGKLALGRAGDYNGEYFAGRMDEIRISNTAVYTAAFTPLTNLTSSANTVVLYHLNEGTGQTVTDSSGNARHGVLGTTSSVQTQDPTWSTDIP
jgi:hypothetical protein